MNTFNTFNKKLHLIFIELFDIVYGLINRYNYNDIIIYILLFCINNIYLLNKLLYLIEFIIKYNKEHILIKIERIEQKIESLDLRIVNIFNNTYLKKNILNNDNKLNILLIKDKNQFNTSHTYIDTNLEIYEILNIDNHIKNINLNYDNIFNNMSNNNYIGLQNINIGFNNYYQLHSFRYVSDELPFNILIYINDIEQIVIKIGNKYKYKFINSKLYKVYNNTDTINNTHKYKSILCNNNIKNNNTKCVNINCKYYHDYFIGHPDNFDNNRTFSSNPVVYNCNNFKDGSLVKMNIKKIYWHQAINIYQSSLSNLLIACMHSQE